MIPSGFAAIISSAFVYAGYTVTSQPRLFKDFSIFFFAPKSMRATLKPSPGSTLFSLQLTSRTTPCTLYSFNCFTTSSRSKSSLVVIIPFITPYSLKIRVRCLVSIPEIPGTSYFFKNSSNVISLRKLLASFAHSLTIRAFGHG